MDILSGRIRGKVMLAGVGCPGRGDDGFGPVLIRRLAGTAWLSTLDCGERPEDFTGDIALARPDTVLIADAVDMGASPGDIALLEVEDLPRGTGETHRASLRAVMEYLKFRTGSTVLLLGVQPAAITGGRALSPQVAASIDFLEEIFKAGLPRPPEKHEDLSNARNQP